MALAEGMMKLMGNTQDRKRMSQNARKIVDTYSEKAVMDKWIGLFNNLTAK